MACIDATVLFAVPGKPVQLMTEEDALSKFPGFDDEQTFYCVEIGNHLFLHYMEHTWERELNKCHMKTLDGARERYTTPTAAS